MLYQLVLQLYSGGLEIDIDIVHVKMLTLNRIRETVRKKNVSIQMRTASRKKNNLKIGQKGNEFVANEKKYLLQLINGRELFNDICKVIASDREDSNVPDSLKENHELIQEVFDAFNEVCKFQEKFATEIERTIDQPADLLKVFESYACAMKFKYSNYIRVHHKIHPLLNDNVQFFKSLQLSSSSTSPVIMGHHSLSFLDELNRPSRWIGTYGLFFADFVKISHKLHRPRSTDDTGTNLTSYEKILDVIKRIISGVDDIIVLNKVDRFPEDIVIERQGALVKSGPVCFKKLKPNTITSTLGLNPRTTKVKSFLFLFQKSLILCKKKHSEDSREESYKFVRMFPITQTELRVVSPRRFQLQD